jgi:hypothetical protein
MAASILGNAMSDSKEVSEQCKQEVVSQFRRLFDSFQLRPSWLDLRTDHERFVVNKMPLGSSPNISVPHATSCSANHY